MLLHRTMFTVLSRGSYCKSSFSSYDKCRIVPVGCRLSDQNKQLEYKSICRLLLSSSSSSHVLLRHVGSNTEHTKRNIRPQIHPLKHNLKHIKGGNKQKRTRKHYSTVLANVSHTARFIVCWLS